MQVKKLMCRKERTYKIQQMERKQKKLIRWLWLRKKER